MKPTNLKRIGCLICIAVVLVGVDGCGDVHRSSTGGWVFEVDGVEYSVDWRRGGAERQGQFELSFLTITHVEYPMTTYSGRLRGKVVVPMHPDSEKIVAKTETVYLVKDKKIVLEKRYQELGIDASRLSTDWIDMQDYLNPILETLIREHIQPQEPDTE